MPARAQTKRFQARSLVASHEATVESPAWKSAADVFKTPKSPSPVIRRTRRSSIYQRKPAKGDITKAKLIVSPPGVKTRARRSSIYQKGGAKLLSPGSLPARTRRTSMYVRSNLQSINEFSKVWSTPIKPISVKSSPEKIPDVEKRKGKTPQKQSSASKSASRSAKKSGAAKENQENNMEGIEIEEPKTRQRKTPAMKMLMKQSDRKSQSPSSANVQHIEVQEVTQMVDKTPSSRKRKTPATKKSAAKSLSRTKSKSAIKTRLEAQLENMSPEPVNKKRKTPAAKKSEAKSGRKSPKTPAAEKVKVQLETKLAEEMPTPAKKIRKTPAPKKSAKSATPVKSPANKNNNQAVIQTSTPKKSFESMSGKSFYGTPKQTPVSKVQKRPIQISTAPKSTKRGKRVSMVVTPKVTPKQQVKGEKKHYRKTPKPVKRPFEDTTMTSPSPVVKERKVVESVKSTLSSSEVKKIGAVKVKLSPMEMISVLKSAEEEEEKAAEITPPMSMNVMTLFKTPGQDTPLGVRKERRLKSRKLTEVVDLNQSVKEGDISVVATSPNVTLDLNETINTDSRSSRCTIL